MLMWPFDLAQTPLYWLGIIYLCIELVGIWFAFHAILNSRTSEAAIAWAITLITLPIFVLPLYWIFGSSRFDGYRESFRQASTQGLDHVYQAQQNIIPYHINALDGLDEIIKTAESLSITPFCSHNWAQLLINGDETYRAMLNAIDNAQDYVLLQFYIVHNDHVGETFRRALTRKIEQGVRVYFLYDEIGSHRISSRYLSELKLSGANVSSFNEDKGVSKYLHMNFRNHRKIVIVDGLKAFIGGLNLGDEYLGKDKKLGYWRDTHIVLQGPSVPITQSIFVRDWYWSTQSVPRLNWQVNKAEDLCQQSIQMTSYADISSNCDQKVMILETGPADDKPVCSLFLCAVINQAKQRLWFASPYFVPDQEMIQALKNAALRGVDVRIILPEKNDNYFIYLTSFAYYRELQGYNIKIYRYTKGFSHQKVILMDEGLAGIGTVNLDNRSIHLNFEVSAFVADRLFVQHVEQMLEEDMAQSFIESIDDFNQQPLWFRTVTRLFYLLSPIL